MNKVTALYLRLSVDDDSHKESDSIQAQRLMLRDYAMSDPLLSDTEIIEVVDDGWSGTNFERPGVKALLERTRKGEVGCILVKDSSRWGRNYVEVSEYLDHLFPFLGVRFISVNDSYDSNDHLGRTAPIDMAFGTIMHDIYCKELSVKVRQSYVRKAEKGEFLCGFAPFGYEKSAEVKNKLVIDEEAAVVVRRIFALACEGNTTSQIAAILNTENVPTPLMYRKKKGKALRGNNSAVTGLWYDKNVRKILLDERYTGTQVSGKTRRKKVGGHAVFDVPEDQWIKVPGAHEPIVTDEVFQKAQEFICRRKKVLSHERHNLFAHKIRCGHCGRALRYQNAANPYHYCTGRKLGYDTECFEERVYVTEIKSVLLPAVKAEAGKALDRRQKRRKAAQSILSDANAMRQEIDRLTAQSAHLERRGMSLYEDYAEGRLDRDAYLAVKAKDQTEASAAQARLAELCERLAENPVIDLKAADDDSLLQRVLAADDVTGEIMTLVEGIKVYDAEHIEIRFSFGDSNV
ncbi:recombinase family protein [Christensenellaceae bacterium OttesenSCG-928-M15]|nr:recombinase family protein [Christensenellaceae bacterium OttesenSCG-928-M15]